MTLYSPPYLHDGSRWRNMRIGLLGGSFNPPHEGHMHISLMALHGLKLDVIWWLVTPQNPLKPTHEMSFDKRLQQCRAMVKHPRILVSAIENEIGCSRSYETIGVLKDRFPHTAFIWLTGMDNALTFHHWYRWKDILQEVATAHIARPPAWSLIENCPLKLYSGQNHIHLFKGEKVPLRPKNTYWLMQKPMLDISSTEIRNII